MAIWLGLVWLGLRLVARARACGTMARASMASRARG